MSFTEDVVVSFSRGGLIEIDIGGLESNTKITNLDLAYLRWRFQYKDVIAVAELLGRNTTLTTMNLAGNGIGEDVGAVLAASIEMNTTLTTLYLEDNSLGEAGVAIADALEKNTTLTELDLRNNNLEEDSGVAFASALDRNTTLVELRLSFNAISQPVLDEIASKLTGREPPCTGPLVKPALPSLPR